MDKLIGTHSNTQGYLVLRSLVVCFIDRGICTLVYDEYVPGKQSTDVMGGVMGGMGHHLGRKQVKLLPPGTRQQGAAASTSPMGKNRCCSL